MTGDASPYSVKLLCNHQSFIAVNQTSYLDIEYLKTFNRY